MPSNLWVFFVNGGKAVKAAIDGNEKEFTSGVLKTGASLIPGVGFLGHLGVNQAIDGFVEAASPSPASLGHAYMKNHSGVNDFVSDGLDQNGDGQLSLDDVQEGFSDMAQDVADVAEHASSLFDSLFS